MYRKCPKCQHVYDILYCYSCIRPSQIGKLSNQIMRFDWLPVLLYYCKTWSLTFLKSLTINIRNILYNIYIYYVLRCSLLISYVVCSGLFWVRFVLGVSMHSFMVDDILMHSCMRVDYHIVHQSVYLYKSRYTTSFGEVDLPCPA